MSLTQTWLHLFQSSTRMRGRSYYAAGRVTQIEPQPGEMVRAMVRGRKLYTVTIRNDTAGATPQCTCDAFKSGQYCKHLWATLLDIQSNGLLHEPTAITAPGEEGEAGDTAALDESASTDVVEVAAEMPKARKRDPRRSRHRRTEAEWITRLTLLRPPAVGIDRPAPPVLPNHRLVCYQILPELSARHNGMVVEIQQRQPARNSWGRPRELKIHASSLMELADPIDRELCALIVGSQRLEPDEQDRRWVTDRPHAMYQVPPAAQRSLLRQMIATGRCFADTSENAKPLRWDEHPEPWTLWLVSDDSEDHYEITVQLRRGEQHLAISQPLLVLGGPSGVVIHKQTAATFDDREAFRWVQQYRDDLRRHGAASPIVVPKADMDKFLDRLYLLPQLPEIDFPADLGRPVRSFQPVPHLEMFSPSLAAGNGAATRQQLLANVWFAYDEHRVRPEQPGRFVGALGNPLVDTDDEPVDDVDEPAPLYEASDATSESASEPDADSESVPESDDASASASASQPESRVNLIRRDLNFERQAIAQLPGLGFRPNTANGTGEALVLSMRDVGEAIARLNALGWKVQADRHIVRSPGTVSLSISSGMDWFELRGGVRYETDTGTQIIPLPDILAAARSGRSMITLADGSEGILPDQWLSEHGLLTSIGQLEGDHLRFRSSQAALLDTLLTEQELEAVDERFALARQRIRQFTHVQASQPPADFNGSLRPYQCEGMGWLKFLRWFGMGGILADDMGLGKTIQVLALLDAVHREGLPTQPGDDDVTRASRQRADRPSLVVAPRSVVFNWVDEAARFTPQLRVMTYAGNDRDALRSAFKDHDVIVMSYGLLRRDIADLSNYEFDAVILDEAQAIKNPHSQGAKAARLLRANHRLALTGTPVENHLGDLWSIFEFLNPGLLGASASFSDLLKGGMADPGSVDGARQAGRALRPFILRRTKKQVLHELPDKTEQTILCEMDPEQRQIYDQLREHYRGTLLKQLDTTPGNGVGRSAMLVLEALLRLRQAACHPALIDPARVDGPSAKLDALVEQLVELIEEGHKALVFSQFTSFLALVRTALDARGITYEYLDGQTRNRRDRVERFQNDDECPVFLISLKAGGLGLNLTAAEYVFILDPWWNPAVEQQAIDRAHRIGQTRHVFAYRLICENTVEQRIAQLQDKKRKLADAIVGEQENLLRSLTREDLEALLS